MHRVAHFMDNDLMALGFRMLSSFSSASIGGNISGRRSRCIV